MLQEPARKQLDIKASDTLWGLDRAFAMDAAEIAAVIPRLHEFMFHPCPASAELADADTECLLALRSYAAGRLADRLITREDCAGISSAASC